MIMQHMLCKRRDAITPYNCFTYFLYYFLEREENVKADIFAAYITLLRQTRPVASQTLDADVMEDDSG